MLPCSIGGFSAPRPPAKREERREKREERREKREERIFRSIISTSFLFQKHH
jgi:hypothetical protein